MSLTYNKNKSGPNINLWGTPQVKFPWSENFLSILTLQVLSDEYDSNHKITFSENPKHRIVCVNYLISVCELCDK